MNILNTMKYFTTDLEQNQIPELLELTFKFYDLITLKTV